MSELPHALSYLSLFLNDLRFSLAAPASIRVGGLAHHDDLLLQSKPSYFAKFVNGGSIYVIPFCNTQAKSELKTTTAALDETIDRRKHLAYGCHAMG